MQAPVFSDEEKHVNTDVLHHYFGKILMEENVPRYYVAATIKEEVIVHGPNLSIAQ